MPIESNALLVTHGGGGEMGGHQHGLLLLQFENLCHDVPLTVRLGQDELIAKKRSRGGDELLGRRVVVLFVTRELNHMPEHLPPALP